MLLFRSEGHVDRWLAGRERGAVISITKVAELAAAWWHDRLSLDWEPRTRDQNQAILDDLGLTDPFWRLGAASATREDEPSPNTDERP